RSALRAVFEQTAPARATLGHPRLTKAGTGERRFIWKNGTPPIPLLSKEGRLRRRRRRGWSGQRPPKRLLTMSARSALLDLQAKTEKHYCQGTATYGTAPVTTLNLHHLFITQRLHSFFSR